MRGTEEQPTEAQVQADHAARLAKGEHEQRLMDPVYAEAYKQARRMIRGYHDAVRIVERFADGGEGPPLLESEILRRAAHAQEASLKRGESTVRGAWAVRQVLTDETLGYQRLVPLEDVARALGLDPPRGTIDGATERGREEARRRARES